MYAEGAKVPGRYTVVFGRPGEGEGCRLGITATRKIGGAVVRNRARRRVRELYRRHAEALPGSATDLVVNVRRGCAEAPWRELEEDYLLCMLKLARRLSRPAR